VSRRTGFTDSALVRLLARLTDVNVPESKKSFSDELSQWLGWKDAIALYSALDGSPTTPSLNASVSVSTEESEFNRVRATLVNAIAEDRTLMRNESADVAADFAPYRRRYLARQQTMAARIGPLRNRLRTKLESRSPAMAQLAAVDAVMEQALNAHEQSLLATIPVLLDKHFKRLMLTNEADRAASESDIEVPPAAWLDVFINDMEVLSLAELDTRLQPIEGLLEALRKN
jgi:hypothetical protein